MTSSVAAPIDPSKPGQGTSRWLEPMQPLQIEQFIETYMPWIFDQRRRAVEQGLNYSKGGGQTNSSVLSGQDGGAN